MLNRYLAIHAFEQSGFIYRLLGVHIFKKFLPTGGDYVLRFFNLRLVKKHTIVELEKCLVFTTACELMHLLGALLMLLLFTLHPTLDGFLINLVLNIYPVMVQRYNRGRIMRILAKRGVTHPLSRSVFD